MRPRKSFRWQYFIPGGKYNLKYIPQEAYHAKQQAQEEGDPQS